MNYILLSEKKWHNDLFYNLQKQIQGSWTLINKREKFILEEIENLTPDFIFIPHWSYIIPSEIYDNFTCVVFHMTDLPYGRGGSPLQNLIIRGHKNTMISALKVEKGLDTGPIFLKSPLSLSGTAEEIFIRASAVIEKMIKEIVTQKLKPEIQLGTPYLFERRKPEEGNIMFCEDIEQVYDFIRMLDCEGYPNAFLENEKFRFEFSRAALHSGNKIIANVRIVKK